jgi:hypothetical protein
VPAAVAVPPFVTKKLAQVRRDPGMGAAMRALEKRGDLDPLRASLAGAGMVESSREYMDEMLDDRWERTPVPATVDELVVGAGLHAAIYCAVRQAEGHPRPLVLEARDLAGGAMAFGRRAGFYLNSRNRPGGLSSPGRNGALNVLPAAPVQPADLSADEFQRSVDVAYVVRMTLAMSARVRTGARVLSVEPDPDGGPYAVTWGDSRVLKARRVVWACGLGEPILRGALKLITFPDLMARMDETFPLRGLRRVAVVGAGDSGKTAIEALTGQGPRPGWSPASVDYVEKIDWYGVTAAQRNRDGWVSCARSRYRRIGGLLPQVAGGEARVLPRGNASSLSSGYEMAFVDDRPYDLVVDCRGYRLDRTALDSVGFENVGFDVKTVGTRPVGTTDGRELYVVGPAAALAFTTPESNDLAANPENATALFRYAERTAALAAALPGVSEKVARRG